MTAEFGSTAFYRIYDNVETISLISSKYTNQTFLNKNKVWQ